MAEALELLGARRTDVLEKTGVSGADSLVVLASLGKA